MTLSETVQELEGLLRDAELEVTLATTRVHHVRATALAARLGSLLQRLQQAQNPGSETLTAPTQVVSYPTVV